MSTKLDDVNRIPRLESKKEIRIRFLGDVGHGAIRFYELHDHDGVESQAVLVREPRKAFCTSQHDAPGSVPTIYLLPTTIQRRRDQVL